MKDKVRANHAWDPGLSSEIPARLMPRATLFRPENSFVSYAEAKEAAQFCGLSPADMVELRVERLVAHEVLIRVTADLSVPDGPEYAELGINMRGMIKRIFEHLQTDLATCEAQQEELRQAARTVLRTKLQQDLRGTGAEQMKRRRFSLFKRKVSSATPAVSRELGALETWKSHPGTGTEAACSRALVRIVSGIYKAQGRVPYDDDLIESFALRLVMMDHGATQIGAWVAPRFEAAAKAEGYRFLPKQESPCFLNVKGASASGKSTIRPLQRQLADRIGIPWEDFALISPDYWRKFLLAYDSLGEDFKYAAMLTGQELELIDKKLDDYVAQKAQAGFVPHMLIDRFRFDSFLADGDAGKRSSLLTRFGKKIYLFFIITPPADTVERAWKRGLTTGRYKAVDDLLYHNIEAYTGIPRLFFNWIQDSEKEVHFEFLDNSVPLGERPRTIAFGWNQEMTILDPKRMTDVDRFAHVDLTATRPDHVLKPAPDQQTDFVAACLGRFKRIRFAERSSGSTIAVAERDGWIFWHDSAAGTEVRKYKHLKSFDPDNTAQAPELDIEYEARHTVGAWGANT